MLFMKTKAHGIYLRAQQRALAEHEQRRDEQHAQHAAPSATSWCARVDLRRRCSAACAGQKRRWHVWQACAAASSSKQSSQVGAGPFGAHAGPKGAHAAGAAAGLGSARGPAVAGAGAGAVAGRVVICAAHAPPWDKSWLFSPTQ